MSDCTRLLSVEVTSSFRLILTNSMQGSTSSANRLFRELMNLGRCRICSGRTLSQLSMRGRIPMELGSI